MEILKPYAVYIGDAQDEFQCKTARGLIEWIPDNVVCYLKEPNSLQSLKAPLAVSMREAKEKYNAETLVCGYNSKHPGHTIPPSWEEAFIAALDARLNVACGSHAKLTDNARLVAKAKSANLQLIDFRYNDTQFALDPSVYAKRSSIRVLTCGQDTNIGKKYTAKRLATMAQRIGISATFCPTGQTGRLIAAEKERAVVIDTLVADYISSAAAWLTPSAEPEHMYFVEGQGALLDPSSGFLVMGLIQGACPDYIVFVVDPTRQKHHVSEWPITSFKKDLKMHIDIAKHFNPKCKIAAISVNLQRISDSYLHSRYIEEYSYRASEALGYYVSALDVNDTVACYDLLRDLQE